MEGRFLQHMERIFDIRLTPSNITLTPRIYPSLFHKENVTSRYRDNTYPWILPMEGLLYIYISREDSEHEFGLTFLKNGTIEKHAIICFKIYENRLRQWLQVMCRSINKYQLLEYSQGFVFDNQPPPGQYKINDVSYMLSPPVMLVEGSNILE